MSFNLQILQILSAHQSLHIVEEQRPLQTLLPAGMYGGHQSLPILCSF